MERRGLVLAGCCDIEEDSPFARGALSEPRLDRWVQAALDCSMTETQTAWSIPGAQGEAILGNTHVPGSAPRGVVLIVHGFLGYKDYGMFPVLARSFADAGFIAHRFNLSNSGMTNDIETFARPDLFERDTWHNQVTDVQAVINATNGEDLAGTGLPVCLFGHSRGGDTCLLAAADMSERKDGPVPCAVVTAAAPSALCRLDESVQSHLLEHGSLEHTSNRTGQTLRIGRAWLLEQLDDPALHDLCARVRSISCPMLFVHGEDDPTVPLADAEELAEAGRSGQRSAQVRLIPGANHVFNTPNPMPTNEAPPEALGHLIDAAVGFFRTCTG